MFELTAEQLFVFAFSGVIIALVLEYFPKLSGWYNTLTDNIQRLIVLGSGFVVVLGAFGLACIDILTNLGFSCTWPGLYDAMLAYIAFIVASQSAYLVLPKPDRS